MDKDIHYYGIGFLARAAGFTKQHALIIAYASQYVDNSTESEPIRVGDLLFDPVRTSHAGLRVFDWAVQKRIYIPFHFIPANPFDPASSDYTFVTHKNSTFANLLFRDACQKSTDELLRLIRIGIALHTLADSWAHHGFSGREDPLNDVEAIYHFQDGTWKPTFLENIFLDILPKVGHAQAGFFPEYPFLYWQYTRDATKEKIERNNPKEYIHAAETIHRLLVGVKKSAFVPALPWKEIKPKVQDVLESHEVKTEKRCENWRKLYKDVFGETAGYQYDPQQWRRDALNPKFESEIEWDEFSPSDFERLAFTRSIGFYKTPWVKFHKAALQQRNFVLEHLC